MGEILESLCLLCNPRCWESLCNADCFGKCIECPGQCISGSLHCLKDCCGGLNCNFCQGMCSNCCSCSSGSCSKLFASNLCKGIENDCLSMFNCNSFIGNFSLGLQSMCAGYADRLCDSFYCWLFFCPADCLTTIGYSRAGYLNRREERKKKKNHNLNNLEPSGTDQEVKNVHSNRVEPFHQPEIYN